MSNQNKQLEALILACIDTSKAMLDEYKTVIPFGIRGYENSDDMKMNCPAGNDLKADWNDQIDQVVSELKSHIQNENVSVTALVTELKSDEESAIGLQVETALSCALFVYPYSRVDNEWKIEAPTQTDQLLPRAFSG